MSFPPADRGLNLLIWAGLFGALALWQAITLLRPDLPSAGAFFGFLKRSRIARWGLLAGWFWLGWHVWVRGSW